MEYGDLIIDSTFILIAIGFGQIGLFNILITGGGIIGIEATTMAGMYLITLGTIGIIDLGALLTTVIYGGIQEEILM